MKLNDIVMASTQDTKIRVVMMFRSAARDRRRICSEITQE